jgi:hypothetical protein
MKISGLTFALSEQQRRFGEQQLGNRIRRYPQQGFQGQSRSERVVSAFLSSDVRVTFVIKNVALYEESSMRL